MLDFFAAFNTMVDDLTLVEALCDWYAKKPELLLTDPHKKARGPDSLAV